MKTSLNLPSYEPRLRTMDHGQHQIWDPIRAKWLTLTPEEWVRQHFINYLITHKQVPPALIKQEHAFSYNHMAFRADVVVFNRQLQPRIVVECKASTVHITQKVMDQAARYNLVLDAPYLVITNGLKHYCSEIKKECDPCYSFISDIPAFDLL